LFIAQGEIMRRSALYLAGAVVATGAAMAFAGPASAAPAAPHATSACNIYYCDYSYNSPQLNLRQYTSQNASVSSGNSQSGFFNVITGGGSASNTSTSTATGWLF
jgi:hypothetical protein